MSSVSFTGSYSDDVPKQRIINCCFCMVMNVISEYYYDYFLIAFIGIDPCFHTLRLALTTGTTWRQCCLPLCKLIFLC